MFSLNLERILKFEKALSKTMTAKEAQNLQTVFRQVIDFLQFVMFSRWQGT